MPNLKNIIFFNHWHYGDLFSTRGLVMDIKRNLPGINVYYAHTKNSRAVADLCQTLNQAECDDVLSKLSMWQRFGVNEDTIFINTWVGSYEGVYSNVHPSYMEHMKIYRQCYRDIRQNFGLDFSMSPDPWLYVPSIDYSIYNTDVADAWLADKPEDVILICNGPGHSAQSSVNDMAEAIAQLATANPQKRFLCTCKTSTDLPNVYYTDDIFLLDCDICEISYISSLVPVIVGKNNGPFSYANTATNLKNYSKVFLCLSHKAQDTLPWELNINCDFRFSARTTANEITGLIQNAIDDSDNNRLTSGFTRL
jgi:hypothetical protein